jgi:hypothetical protein
MSRFKIIVFLMAVSVLAGIFAAAAWIYLHIIEPDVATGHQISAMREEGAPPPDPGIPRFDKAIEFIRDDDLDTGRSALYELVRTFPESSRVAEAKRIIGEMNMDMLFDFDLNPLRKDYIVQPGDALSRIASKNQTTVECIMRANGLQSGMLQPGDHLFVFPLDFSLVIHVSRKTLTLLRNDRFFREYAVLDMRIPVPRAPYEAKISDKPAWFDNKRAGVLSPDFLTADKWLTVEKSQNSFNIRALPKARPVEAIAVPAKGKGKTLVKKSQRAETLAGTAVDDDVPPAPAAPPTTGVFLPAEDIEELFTILRTGTPVKVLR